MTNPRFSASWLAWGGLRPKFAQFSGRPRDCVRPGHRGEILSRNLSERFPFGQPTGKTQQFSHLGPRRAGNKRKFLQFSACLWPASTRGQHSDPQLFLLFPGWPNVWESPRFSASRLKAQVSAVLGSGLGTVSGQATGQKSEPQLVFAFPSWPDAQVKTTNSTFGPPSDG